MHLGTPKQSVVISRENRLRFKSVIICCKTRPRIAVQEEFMSAFGDEVRTLRRQEQVQQELEQCTEDMDRYLPYTANKPD